MGPDRKLPAAPRRRPQPEDQRVVVHLRLGHQRAVTVVGSWETQAAGVSSTPQEQHKRTATRPPSSATPRQPRQPQPLRTESGPSTAQTASSIPDGGNAAAAPSAGHSPRSFFRTNVLWNSRASPRFVHLVFSFLRRLTWIFPTEKAVWTAADAETKTRTWAVRSPSGWCSHTCNASLHLLSQS